MRRFTSRNFRRNAPPFAIPDAPPGAAVNVVSSAPAVRPVRVQHQHHEPAESRAAALMRLCADVGAAGRYNHQRGRWFRFTRFQAEVVGTCIIYVVLCIMAALIRTGAITVHWLRGY